MLTITTQRKDAEVKKVSGLLQAEEGIRLTSIYQIRTQQINQNKPDHLHQLQHSPRCPA
ncbi:uncharacterized protein ASCRUDRAFT_82213 [Ascoidea rubescens DSM 1968]|uniref:Uncharacterized protein n=1 Tax=Ascoidea rubescens DSM 1968 TaxID=1344418 RepID=A0A1D2VCE1_9ASCO|nr:hypothetical protein ASCRUDRAFT_82213 [Ascoidea rubescens DSM 1968]ODV59210.1 hypothetical protein ASCRUDRAFT_82213 [Ascoidea rubescens DSM 1968]